MDYTKIIVPFLSNAKIKEKADIFCQKYWEGSLPVDIEIIIDVKLMINVIPIPNWRNFCDVDALLTSSFKDIYVDHNKYLDERYQNRLRFSFAHEIGHLVLHRSLYNSFDIKSFEDYYRLFQQLSAAQYGYIETQANKFANYLLIPRGKLKIEKDKLLKSVEFTVDLNKVDDQTLNSYYARPLASVFGVSEEAMEIALNQMENSN